MSGDGGIALSRRSLLQREWFTLMFLRTLGRAPWRQRDYRPDFGNLMLRSCSD